MKTEIEYIKKKWHSRVNINQKNDNEERKEKQY
jgi:hypothetical protein